MREIACHWKRLLIAFPLLLMIGLPLAQTADAYPGMPGGLLTGRCATYSVGGTRCNFTDNNTGTGHSIRYQSWVQWTLPKAADITRLQWHTSANNGYTVRIQGFNAAGAVVGSYGFGSQNENRVRGQDVNWRNVVRIRFENQTSNFSMNLNEFDVFGQIVYPAPAALTATPDTRRVTLSWQPVASEDFTGYNVYKDGQKLNEAPIQSTSYAVTGLEPDVEHSYHVAADYGAQGVRASPPVTRAAYGDPTERPVLEGIEYPDRIELAWTDVEGAVRYDLYANGTLLQSDETNAYVHILPFGVSRTYYVEAIDKYGRKMRSAQVAYMTRDPPLPVVPKIELQSRRWDRLQVRWTVLRPPYQVYLDGELKGTYTTNSALFLGLEAESEHEIKVTYVDRYGRLVEGVSTFRTDEIPAPIYPRFTYLALTHTGARLVWNNVGVTYKVFQDGEQIATAKSLFYQVSGLTPQTTYSYYVVAVDQWGRELQSNVVHLTTKAAPIPPDPPGPSQPPPPVSTSGNEDLDKTNDHLVEGANEAKRNGVSLIMVIILIIVLIFGVFWLVRIFKTKMTRTANAAGSGGAAGAATVRSRAPPLTARTGIRPDMNDRVRHDKSHGGASARNKAAYSRTKSNGQSPRRKYYVEKNFARSGQGKKRRR